MKTTQIAAQLYTCRRLLQTPEQIAATFRRVRAAGYTAVQLSGLGPIEPAELSRILDGEGLVCCSTHEPSENILNHPEAVVEKLRTHGCTSTAYPYPANVDMSDPAAVHRLAEKLEHSARVLAEAGLVLCYHNHHHEFRKIGGRTILELLYEGAPTMQAELDTYWVQYGGGCPIAWCRRMAGRTPLLHLKDYVVNSENQPQYCEVGAGNLDFAAIIAAAEEGGCQWFIVEQDETPGDPVDSLAQSFEYLASNICKP